jgi:hypothetical protein
MAILPLEEVSKFDNGDNTAESFVNPVHNEMQDFVRLVCDLLLGTRQDETLGVVFSDIPALVEEASIRMSRRTDEIIDVLGIVEVPGRPHLWTRWDQRPPGTRRATPREVSDFEGESRLLYDAAAGIDATHARRLFAAWGVYCCERAIRAMKARNHASVVAVFVASAGALLGHANWCWAWQTKCDLVRDERRRGGFARLMKDKEAAAKVDAKGAARNLWPEAHRKGWTAIQFHSELTRRGHAIAPDTARKWLTFLRKTGTC